MTLVRFLFGGVLIGLAAALVLLVHGRVAGISGITGGLLRERTGSAFRLWFLAGLVGGGWLMVHLLPGAFTPATRVPTDLVAAGLLVGFGTSWANGCTSGHGVCGVARLSPRSIAATLTFMVTGVVAAVGHHLLGAGR